MGIFVEMAASHQVNSAAQKLQKLEIWNLELCSQYCSQWPHVATYTEIN